MMFRNETANVVRRASLQTEGGQGATPLTVTRQPTPDNEITARQFFFHQFVSPSHLSFLEDETADDVSTKAIVACGMAAIVNREDDPHKPALARQYYGEAITATNAALRDPGRAKDDSTLLSIYLLSIFERLSWEQPTSISSWKHHVEGSAQVLQMRGRDQTRTRNGALLFREIRESIVTNCLMSEVEVPVHIVDWTKALEPDVALTASDQLAMLAARVASIRSSFRTGLKSDAELAELSANLDRDLVQWSESTGATGSVEGFSIISDPEISNIWAGLKHEYSTPQARRFWNKWRCLHILLSRTQEAIWRRSWPVLARPYQLVLDSQHHRSARKKMAIDICVTCDSAFHTDTSAGLEPGSISEGYLQIMPLSIAGTCFLEQLKEPVVTPGGRRMILVDEPLHLNLFDESSTQLAWVIERLDHIAEKIGINWAAAMSRFLRGESGVMYDLERSRVFNNGELEAMLYGDFQGLEEGSIPRAS